MKRRAVILLAIAGVVLAGGWWFARPGRVRNSPPPPGPIVAFGDSLTAGTGAPRGTSYPDELARLIGRPVLNLGVPGETIADAARRVDDQLLALRPGIVIVLLGGNDVLRRQNLDESFDELERLVRRVQEAGAMVVVVGLRGVTPVGGLGARYRRLARQTQALYVPNILGGVFSKRELMADGVHPNAAGYRVIA
ncbi:MAG TPA: GDSL-type esterase/lipase family protein, partial [Candidatus Sumerlaeota bacterium]|nr:GDSL-type esterase/lipase family protein [Candidatus Sumerlaeota bacterium]